MKIRKAKRGDLQTMFEIYIEGLIDEEKIQFPKKSHTKIRKDLMKRKSAMNKSLAKIISDKNRRVLVIEVSNDIVGFAECYIEMAEGKKVGGIGRFYIKKKYRNKGLGTKVMKELLDYLKSRNVKEVESYFFIKNNQSFKLHKKFGFVPEVYKVVKTLR